MAGDSNATALASLQTARDQIAARIVEITASQNPSYSVGNRTMNKTEYLAQLRAELRNVVEDIQLLGGPFLIKSRSAI